MKNLNIINEKDILDILKRKFYITIYKIISAWSHTLAATVKKEKALVLEFFKKEKEIKQKEKEIKESYNNREAYDKIRKEATANAKNLLMNEFPINIEKLKKEL